MIYEYRCNECQEVSEFSMKMSDPHPEACPKCGEKGALERIISKTSFALKGSGWYTTDYKKPAAASPKATSSEAKPTEVKPVEKKAEPKGGGAA
ncbi:zinc ribbon domain-containing protein [bacterium]|nr:zinc ribbon domain-containing protein [bacterium]